jgi:DNA-directed RNA polymerase specialized sigma24 family protein
MSTSMTTAMRSAPPAEASLSDPELRRYLERYVRRRVPGADADDAIQSVLCAALEARRVPTDREELRKWLTGIARHKVGALYQKASREHVVELPEVEASNVPFEDLEASSLMRWAERQARFSEAEGVDETLDWMARESDGEKLETIAAEAKLPPARVRQRVSRLRRWMKARWVAELAAFAGALVVLALSAWWLSHRPVAPLAKRSRSPDASWSVPTPERPSPTQRAYEVRKLALDHCDHDRFVECLRGLDDAARLDPEGDAHPTVGAARRRAARELEAPAPTPIPLPIPIPRRTSTGGTTPGSTMP